MRIKNPIPFLNLILAGLTWLAATPAQALTYTFTGTITDTEHSPPVSVGDTFTLIVAIDPVSSGPGFSGGTLYPVSSGSFAFSGGYAGSWTSIFGTGAEVRDNSDLFVVGGSAPSPFPNSFFSSFSDISMSIRLFDSFSDGEDAISSEALPTAINVADWQTERSFSLSLHEFRSITGAETVHTAKGSVESVTVAPDSPGGGSTSVPDAGSTLPLLGLAFAGLAWFHRRSR